MRDLLQLSPKQYALLDEEGIEKLRLEVRWKKAPKWIVKNIEEAQKVLDDGQKEKLERDMEREGGLQFRWINDDDCKLFSKL